MAAPVQISIITPLQVPALRFRATKSNTIGGVPIFPTFRDEILAARIRFEERERVIELGTPGEDWGFILLWVLD